MAYLGSAVGAEVPVAKASGQSIRSGPDIGGDCKKPAVVATEPRLAKRRPLSLPHPELTVVTDALLLGWGGHLGEVEIGGL